MTITSLRYLSVSLNLETFADNFADAVDRLLILGSVHYLRAGREILNSSTKSYVLSNSDCGMNMHPSWLNTIPLMLCVYEILACLGVNCSATCIKHSDQFPKSIVK